MYDSPFTPKGPTYLVGAANPVQILSAPDATYSVVRVINTAGSLTRLGWSPAQAGPPSINTSAPVAGTPSANVVSIAANGKETLTLPTNCWVQASQASLEVTPGEGFV